MFNWLWFGGDLKKRLRKCESKLAKCLEERDALKSQLAAATRANEKFLKQIEALKKEVEELRQDCIYFEERVKQLSSALAKSVQIPDISDLVVERKAVRPWALKELTEKYQVVVADAEYYALPKDAWEQLLDRIEPERLKLIKTWRREISDCDDWAIIMHALVTAAFIKAKLDKQGAFMIVWSNTHAYNAYMDIEENVWIYEPQSGKTVGKLGETDKPYDSRWLWFPGEKHSYSSMEKEEAE